MQARGKGWRPRPEVRGETEVGGTRQGADAHSLGDSTADGKIRLQNIRSAQIDQVAKVEARTFALTSGYGNVRTATQLGEPPFVVRRHRLFQPRDVAVAGQMAKLLGFGHRKCSVGIAHEINIRPESRARRLDPLGGLQRRAIERTDAHLYRTEATRNIALQLRADLLHGGPSTRGVSRHAFRLASPQ